jgi:hypothetical protein
MYSGSGGFGHHFAEAAFGPANRSSRFNKLWAWALPDRGPLEYRV